MSESGTNAYSCNSQDDSKGGEVDDVVIQFLKELDASADPKEVLLRYCQLDPRKASEFRSLAAARHVLVMSEPVADDRAEHDGQLGDFRIVREIARGGMGAIYEAVQEPFQRRVAVKTIRGDRRHVSAGARDRFFREQEVLARLHHTHIVPIHAGGQEGDLEYFAMPYIEGAALHHVVRSAWYHETTRPSEETPSLAELAQAASDGSPAPDAGDPSAETIPLATDHHGRPGREHTKLILSSKYLRSVAKVMADAGDALHHAHEAGVIHRDLKPANIMVDIHEHCWILDFGLAAYKAARNGEGNPNNPGVPGDGAASGVMGTPGYMAPEQFRSRADAQTDVWGLGIILCELLTLRPAFPSRDRIESSEPRSPGEFVGNLPRDLEAICLKALRQEPGQRYATAREFADDLRRWLAHEPVRARRARALRRVGLWARRNKGWAAAIAMALTALASTAVGGILIGKIRADAARERQQEAEARVIHEHQETEAQRREVLIQQMQQLRLTFNLNGWSRNAWDLARKAAAIRTDSRIQSEAAALLAGQDALVVKSFKLPGTGLAFDTSGRRLMISGSNWVKREPARPVQIWDSTTDQPRTIGIEGDGVFGFHADGAPVFLTVPRNAPSVVQLWDVAKAQVIREFKSPLKGNSRIGAWALTPDGKYVAASAGSLNEKGDLSGQGVIACWDTTSGLEIFRSENTSTTDIALAQDASLLAAGHPDGQISVWSLPSGELIATLRAGRNRISCLGFGRDPVQQAGPKPLGSGWLLAAGDAGGGVVIWEPRNRVPRSICHGPTGSPEVLALAFSPDGMTLASAGRGNAQLWDIASGRFLLNIDAGNYVTALAFSPDGRRLAVGSLAAFDRGDSVNVWELEPGRGIDKLRGLLGSTFRSIFSPDSRLVAALSSDWHVGIWDRESGRLLHALEVTPGLFTDNAALAFSPDGRRFAFSAGQEASLWDVSTGAPIKTWRLPPGLVDRLAFPEPNRLLLFRTETETGEVGPFGPARHPRVCRVRDLLGSEPVKPLAEIRDCNREVYGAECSPDGKYYVIEGQGGSPGNAKRVANLYESHTGRNLGSLPTQRSINFESATFNFDPAGTALNFAYAAKGDSSFLLGIPSRAVIRQFDSGPGCLGPRATRWLIALNPSADQPSGLALFEQDREGPLIRFVLDNPEGTGLSQFSPDGLHLVWGNTDGGVTVVDLVEIQRRLSELGLGW